MFSKELYFVCSKGQFFNARVKSEIKRISVIMSGRVGGLVVYCEQVE